MTTVEKILALASSGLPNATIADLVGVRPRRVREVIAAVIRAGAPIARNELRTAPPLTRTAPPAGDRP